MEKARRDQARLIAWGVDLLIGLGLGALFNGLGWLASAAYWLLRDGFFEGQSIGKRLMGLKVLVKQAGTRCTFRESILRNLLWVIPVINVVMAVSCVYLLYLAKPPRDRHWGDRLADTVVVSS